MNEHDVLDDYGLVDLPGRGVTFARWALRYPTRPTLMLLHGWTATADLNWNTSYAKLAQSYNVVALDHHGHGRGLRRRHQPFSLTECAHDAAALADVLQLRSIIAVGYSMGGAIAQLLWREHPRLVRGLVLCATGATFKETVRERAVFSAAGAAARAARVMPAVVRTRAALRVMEGMRSTAVEDWIEDDLSLHDWLVIVQAGHAMGAHDARPWLAEIDVPTAVVMTAWDDVVPPTRQRELAEGIPDSRRYLVDGGHPACLAKDGRFVPILLEAVTDVATRTSGQLSAARETLPKTR